VVPKAELDKLVNGLARHPNVAVMSDEIYSRLIYDNQPHVSLLGYPQLQDRLILLDGWSKTYAMTGWRLGYAVWPQDLAPLATKLAVNDHSCVNAATQWAGIAALDGPQDDVESMRRAFDERRKVIVEELNAMPGVRCVMPGGAFYAFPNIKGTGLASATLQDKLLNEAGVAVIAGTSFGAHGEGYLRFSYANSVANIREAMRRMRALLKAIA